MTRRGRLSKLEARQPAPALRVTLTRQIVGGGATGEGEAPQIVRTVRRSFVLYPDGRREDLPGVDSAGGEP